MTTNNDGLKCFSFENLPLELMEVIFILSKPKSKQLSHYLIQISTINTKYRRIICVQMNYLWKRMYSFNYPMQFIDCKNDDIWFQLYIDRKKKFLDVIKELDKK